MWPRKEKENTTTTIIIINKKYRNRKKTVFLGDFIYAPKWFKVVINFY